MFNNLIPKLHAIWIVPGVVLFGSANFLANDKDEKKHYDRNRVLLDFTHSDAMNIPFEKRLHIVVNPKGGISHPDGLAFKLTNIKQLIKNYDNEKRAVLIQVSDESDVSVKAFFGTLDKLVKEIPHDFKGKVILNIQAFR